MVVVFWNFSKKYTRFTGYFQHKKGEASPLSWQARGFRRESL
jgi:hypothetical protein